MKYLQTSFFCFLGFFLTEWNLQQSAAFSVPFTSCYYFY